MSASGSAKSRMERIMRLHDRIDEIKGDIREVYAEEKSDGGDKTAMGAAISHLRKRAKDKDAFDEREALAAVYVNAYNGASHTHAREASQSYAEAKGRGEVEARQQFIDQSGGIGAALSAVLGVEVEMVRADPETGELTDTQEQPETDLGSSDPQSVGAVSPRVGSEYAGTSSDKNPASNSPSVAPPADTVALESQAPRPDATVPLSNSSDALLPVETDRAGAESSPASAVLSEAEIPAFLKADRSFKNPRCEHPDTCAKAHSKDTCLDCTLAWAERPKAEQVMLWQQAMEAAESEVAA